MLNDEPIVKEQSLFVWEAVSAFPESESSVDASGVTYHGLIALSTW